MGGCWGVGVGWWGGQWCVRLEVQCWVRGWVVGVVGWKERGIELWGMLRCCMVKWGCCLSGMGWGGGVEVG